MRVLCFDVGCTDIKYGVIEDGKILIKNKVPNNLELGLANFKENLTIITDLLKSTMGVEYVGVSCAGSIDLETGEIIVSPDHAKFLLHFNFKKFFKDGFNLDCYADNDVNCFGIAESIAGNGQKYNHFLMMTVGTGIGGSIIMDKKTWRGPNYNAGEFGRMIMQNGVKYEDLAATSKLVEAVKKLGYDVKDGVDVFKLYDSKELKDPRIQTTVKNFYDYLAIGVANLVYSFNPQSIIIGGGITNRDQFIDELKEELVKILHSSFYETVQIERSYFKNDGGMMGAYYLVLQNVGEANE